eukprot:ctg_1676.g289
MSWRIRGYPVVLTVLRNAPRYRRMGVVVGATGASTWLRAPWPLPPGTMQRHWTVDAVRGGAVAGAGLSGGLALPR